MLALVGSLLTAVSAAPGRELTDATGRRVTVPDEPRRMASLCTSATDTLLRLGLGDRLVAIDEYSRVVPGAEALPVMGKGSAISREQVIEIQSAIDLFIEEAARRVGGGANIPTGGYGPSGGGTTSLSATALETSFVPTRN